MATVKTGVIQVSGLTITSNGTNSVKIKGTGNTKLSVTSSSKEKDSKKADYILEDYKQLFTGDRTSVSLFAAAATEFDATLYEKYSKIKVINAVAASGAVSLKGNDNANQIIAGAAGATLDGGAGNDTLTGGNGSDTFIYSAGNDLIKNFTASSDSIIVDGATVSDASISGKNVVLKIGKNTLTVEGMASKELAFTDQDGEKVLKDGFLYNSDKTLAVATGALTKTTKITVDAATIDGSAVSKGINISGNSADNSILGGAKNDTLWGADGADTIDGGKGNDKLYGEAGDDLLYCGAGNDSLWGGEGKNEFIYASGDGKDVIFGFTSDDKLTLDNIEFTSATVNSKGTEVALKLGSGSITFKDFAKDTQFHIGDDTYAVVSSGKNKYSFEKQ